MRGPPAWIPKRSARKGSCSVMRSDRLRAAGFAASALFALVPVLLHTADGAGVVPDPAYVDPDFAPRVIGGGGGAVGGNGRLAVIPYELPKPPPEGMKPRGRIGSALDIS